MPIPNDVAERALASLTALPMWGVARDGDALVLHFGQRHQTSDGEAGEYTLRIACAWRVSDARQILVASGDLFTPADPDADLETFDWDVPGASWWDVRLRALRERFGATPPTVATFAADSLGGFRLVLAGGVEVDVFPNSSPAEHVETEFWRLLRPDDAEPHVVVSSAGIALESA